MAGGFRKCRLMGGPFAGWSGDYFDTGQDVAEFGDGAERACYVYRLDPNESTRDATVWKYDAQESERRIRAAGLIGVGTRGVAE